MARPRPIRMLCTYRVRKGKEAAFLRLLARHWPTLRRAGLATSEPARVLRCRGKRGGTFFVETFAWAGAGASGAAHGSPEVLAVWGPMEDLLDGMEFAEIEEVPMRFGRVPGPGPTRPAPPRRRRSPRPRRAGGRG